MRFRPSFVRRFTLMYYAMLILYTLYVLLDTFVIPRSYQAQTAPEVNSIPQAVTITDTGYTDQNVTIRLTQHRVYDTEVYVAEVLLASPAHLKTAFARQTYGRNITAPVSEIAVDCGAVLAINGDYYSARSGYVLRNGEMYREGRKSDQDMLVIDAQGDFCIVNEKDASTDLLSQMSAQQALSFGPTLIENGKISVDETTEISGKSMVSNPRTALAQLGSCHYLFVVSDGRTGESAGLTLYQLAEFLSSLGAQTAYNLDGGGSSTLVFNGRVINKPTTSGRTVSERSVSDIVCIIP